MGGAGVTSACPSMMWRDPQVASPFFSKSSSVGTEAERSWELEFAATDKTTKRRLSYQAVVAGNGTILSLRDASGAAVAPLRQYRYDGLVLD